MIKPEFIVERQGKQFVLYAGLLSLAHGQGLKAIRTRLVQIPAEDNGQTAIVAAEVETERGTFSGIGDANPSNVTRAMLTCTIRLAETRAKARALRDATNIGVAALEELAGEDEHDDRPAPAARGPASLTAQPPQVEPRTDDRPASDAQRRAVERLARPKGIEVDLPSLTQSEAARWIQRLQG